MRGPQVGDLLGGRYEIKAELGRGGMGTVFRVYDHMAAEMVAFKFLTAAPRTHSGPSIERFRRELRVARQVTHVGVVRLHDLLEFDGQLVLSMEYVEGDTLAQRLASSGPLAAQELGLLTSDLARALAAAHRNGVVHRDIKPANIILRASTQRAVIADFGVGQLSRTAEASVPLASGASEADPALTREGELIGTPLYMAPEQLMASAAVGPTADVYAFGLVLFEAATGRRPHGGTTPPALFRQRKEDGTPALATLRPDLPRPLCDVIDRCLRSRPEDRFASGVELREALGSVAEVTGPHSVLTIHEPPLARSWARRHRLGLAVGALLALGLATLGARWQRGRLPASNRCLSFVVRGLEPRSPGFDATEEARLGRAIGRLLEGRLRHRERRVEVAHDPTTTNIEVVVRFQRVADGLSLAAELGPSRGSKHALPTASGRSAAEAIERLLDSVVAEVAAGQPERPASAQELSQMRALGTTSLPAYRAYQRSIDRFLGSIVVDSVAVRTPIEEALRLDPGWPHALALLARIEGEGSRRAAAVLERARRELRDPGRDPVGQQILQAIGLSMGSHHAEAIRILQDALRGSPHDDAFLWWSLEVALLWQHRSDEAIALLGRMHAARPDLQFGADLARALRDVGRSSEVAPLLERWLELAPDNEQALASHVTSHLDRGRMVAAERQAREILFLHGDAPHRQAMLCDVLIAAGRTQEARPIADRLLGGGDIDRVRGHRRQGEIAILEGRFAAAYESLQAAADGRRFGVEGEIVQTLEALRVVASALGRPADVSRHTSELASVYVDLGAQAEAATLRFELALLGRPRAACPEVETALEDVPAGPGRRIARRDMLRAASATDCARCTEVVAEGLSSEERSTLSMYRFGLCAEGTGAHELAGRAFEAASRIRTSAEGGSAIPSAYHSVLARFHRAAVLDRLGKRSEARTEYEAFLAFWGRADRSVPEVERARAALSVPATAAR